jgi:23S rRNA pseudouridine1911/1915/1917 synthase
MHEEKFLELVIPANQGKERLDKFLTRHIGSVSRARLQKLIEEGHIKVNGETAKASHPVAPQEKIEICIPKPKPLDIDPEKLPLNILYEDEHLIVLDKAAGMVVHPAFANYTGTLVNALLYHCGDLSSIGGRQRPGIVHRLDKDTSGVMVVAKNDHAHHHLSNQFRDKTIERKYLAVTWGRFKTSKGKIETHLARSPRDRKRITVQQTGKIAITNYAVAETFRLHSLVNLKLETGRTHQIRVHMSYIGHPVFGDLEYAGRNRQLGGLSNVERDFAAQLLQLMPRQALHACILGFIHPAQERLLHFESDPPDDMQLLLQRLRTDVQERF